MKNYTKILSIFRDGWPFRVTISYRGKQLRGSITDLYLYDLWRSKERGWKDAGNRIYKEVLNQNM